MYTASKPVAPTAGALIAEPFQGARRQPYPLRRRQSAVAQRKLGGEPQQDIHLVFQPLQLVHAAPAIRP